MALRRGQEALADSAGERLSAATPAARGSGAGATGVVLVTSGRMRRWSRTIRKDHVTLSHGQLVFEYLAKGAKQREQAVADEQVCAVVRSLRRRRGGEDQLLVYRSGPRWHDVTAADINDYLREVSGGDYTAKDCSWIQAFASVVQIAASPASWARPRPCGPWANMCTVWGTWLAASAEAKR